MLTRIDSGGNGIYRGGSIHTTIREKYLMDISKCWRSREIYLLSLNHKSRVGRPSPVHQRKHSTVKVFWFKHINYIRRLPHPRPSHCSPISISFYTYIIYRGRSRRRIAVTYRPLPNGTRSSPCSVIASRAALYFMNYSKYFQNGKNKHLCILQRSRYLRRPILCLQTLGFFLRYSAA